MRCLSICALLLASCSTLSNRSHWISGDHAQAQLDRLSALEGSWYTADGSQAEPVLTYQTIAAGSVVVETQFAGQPHERMTVYYLEDDALKLVHYCALGNRPRMVAQSKEGADLYFALDGRGGLSSVNENHMHSAEFHFEGVDRMSQSWALYREGVEVESHGSELERRPARASDDR